jgi:hypothetical protein
MRMPSAEYRPSRSGPRVSERVRSRCRCTVTVDPARIPRFAAPMRPSDSSPRTLAWNLSSPPGMQTHHLLQHADI